MKADEGLFHTKSRVLTLKGEVEMTRGDLVVKTGLATYEPGSRVLLAPEDVVLSEPMLRIQGKDLRLDLVGKTAHAAHSR